MSTEQTIIAACLLNRDAYETLQMHCALNEFTPIGQHWIKQVGRYYDRDKDAKRVDLKVLRSMGVKAADPRHEETLGDFVAVPHCEQQEQNPGPYGKHGDRPFSARVHDSS